MKIIEMPFYVRSPEKQAEMDAIVAELKTKYQFKARPIKPDGMSEADFILSLQSPSTMRTLKMTDAELEEYRNRPMPENWKAVPNAKTIEEAIGQRIVNYDEHQAFEQMRRGPKNDTGMKETDLKPPTLELRERAVTASSERSATMSGGLERLSAKQ